MLGGDQPMENQDNPFLVFALPDIGQEEIDEVVDSLRSGWLTTGPKTKRFEESFAAYIGCKYAIAVNSCTAGLHLALEALGVGSGDKVITTPYTFTATAEVIRYLGADPVFVDIDPQTHNLDPHLLEAKLKSGFRAKAILPVHFAGQACAMDTILALAEQSGCEVVNDAAHALPCTFKGKKIGTLGKASAFSFYATKTLAVGEGGMVVTDSDAMAQRMRIMRLHGINREVWNRYTSSKPNWYYEVVAPGFKYNMSDIMASIGIHQLRKVESFQKRRQQIAQTYTEALADLPLELPRPRDQQNIHAWHLYVIKLCLDRLIIGRDRFIELMAEHGIGTSVHFIPLHMQPFWKKTYNLTPEDFPIATECFQRSVSLPIYTKMTDADVYRTTSAVRKILMENMQ